MFEHWYGGPFVLSGAVMVLAACVLLLLPAEHESESDTDSSAAEQFAP
jgi:hypothetical protein